MTVSRKCGMIGSMRKTFLFFLLGALLGYLAVRLSAQTLVRPEQIADAYIVAKLARCTGATGPANDCSGLFYVEIVQPAGAPRLRLIAKEAEPGFTPSGPNWQ